MTTRSPRAADPFTRACFGTYIMLGWILSGIGAVLPQLRDDLGGLAGFYPSLPGAALLVIGVVALRKRSSSPHSHSVQAGRASVVAALGVLALSMTDVPVVSAFGAVVVAAMAAVLIRLMPAAITSHHPIDASSVMTRANAWSSLASIVAPLAVGGAIEVGLGWRVGLISAPVLTAVAVLALLRSSRSAESELALSDPPPRSVKAARAAGSAELSDPTNLDTGQGVGRPEIRPGNETRAANSTGAPESSHQPVWIDAWAILALSITVEFAFVYFASTYLREEVGMGDGPAAAGTAAFAVGMAASRFLAGSIPRLRGASLMIHLAVTTTGFLTMWALPHPITAVVGIAIAGFGTALLYPIGIGRLMSRFPHSVEAGAARGALASGAALLGSPALLGALRAISNVRIAYLSVPVLITLIAAINLRSDARIAASQ